MKLRLRLYNSASEPPPLGSYLVAAGPRSRAAYLVLGWTDLGKRQPALGPDYRLFQITVDRAPREEALASDRYMEIERDQSPNRRKRRKLAELADRNNRITTGLWRSRAER